MMRRRHQQAPDEPGRLERGTLGRFERRQRWLDERLGTNTIARTTLRKVFLDHWSFLLGEIAQHGTSSRGSMCST